MSTENQQPTITDAAREASEKIAVGRNFGMNEAAIIQRALDAATAAKDKRIESLNVDRAALLSIRDGMKSAIAAKDRKIAELRASIDRWANANDQLVIERNALRAEVERLNKEIRADTPKMLELNRQILADNDQLRAQLAAAQEDSKRLDWLGSGGTEPRVEHAVEIWRQGGRKFRAAIDAARQGGAR